mgnify:CR=1 FL=1
MDFLQNLALAGGLAWGAGVRLYATVFIAGMLARLGYVHLPADLAVLSSDWVLWTSGILAVGDFIADKSPGFDSFWDGVHTFARVPAGIFLAWGAAGDQGPAIQFACALLGGAVVSGTHLAKSSARLAINHSPEPFSNWLTSTLPKSLRRHSSNTRDRKYPYSSGSTDQSVTMESGSSGRARGLPITGSLV